MVKKFTVFRVTRKSGPRLELGRYSIAALAIFTLCQAAIIPSVIDSRLANMIAVIPERWAGSFLLFSTFLSLLLALRVRFLTSNAKNYLYLSLAVLQLIVWFSLNPLLASEGRFSPSSLSLPIALLTLSLIAFSRTNFIFGVKAFVILLCFLFLAGILVHVFTQGVYSLNASRGLLGSLGIFPTRSSGWLGSYWSWSLSALIAVSLSTLFSTKVRYLIMVLGLWVVLTSDSRAGIVAYFVVVSFILFSTSRISHVSRNEYLFLLPIFVVLTATLSLVLRSFSPSSDIATLCSEVDVLLNGRLQIWSSNTPFFGFCDLQRPSFEYGDSLHSLYLDLWFSKGPMIFLLMAPIFVVPVIVSWRVGLKNQNAVASISLILAVAVFGIAESSIELEIWSLGMLAINLSALLGTSTAFCTPRYRVD